MNFIKKNTNLLCVKFSDERRSPLHRWRKPEITRCSSATLLRKFHTDCPGIELSILSILLYETATNRTT